MKALQVAAQFAAYTWYSETRQAPPAIVEEEAKQFAQQNWQAFLPLAHEGLGRLLLRISEAPVACPARTIRKKTSGQEEARAGRAGVTGVGTRAAVRDVA